MASVPRCSRAVATALSPKRTMRPWKATATSSPILDFLLPSYTFRLSPLNPSPRRGLVTTGRQPAALRAPTHARIQQHKLLPSGHRQCSRPVLAAGSPSRGPTVQQCRFFATTETRAKTLTVLNPQMDDSGNEMRLEITSRAATRLSKVMEKDGNPRLALRIQVESGGCHGFQYLMSLVTLPDHLPTSPAELESLAADTESPAIREDDTIFAYAAEQQEGEDPLSAPKIILDTPSLELLTGSKVDFTMELIGSQFKIVDNPLATSSCGCGTSFDIKV